MPCHGADIYKEPGAFWVISPEVLVRTSRLSYISCLVERGAIRPLFPPNKIDISFFKLLKTIIHT